MDKPINILNKELQERVTVLNNRKKSERTEGRILECQLQILRVQQLILRQL